ncbi:hypothetical protein HF325_003774 [Metschnikowia pulcherrima]|uniref:Uncharacterized protein n=1 Tax=Metschnikowia pulcherrima TaxID=27326 RepID=A0A8H7LAX7_9ASCO|nr:hypothetical protein HF325_003774 [Metschnikowia pulcherrima]
MTCRCERNYLNQGLEIIRGASSSGVPVQHASEEHDPDKRTEMIRDDPIRCKQFRGSEKRLVPEGNV